MEKANKKGSFIKQAAILAGAGMLVRFIGFLYRPPMTALIGDTGNAIYGAGYQVYNLLLILSSAGLPAAIGKMVSERIALKQYKNAHRVFRVAFAISGSLGFLFMLIMFLFAKPIAVNICKIPDAYYTLISLAPTIFIVAVMSAFRGYFQGMNTMVPTAFSQIVEQMFNAFFSVFLAWVLVKQSVALGAAGGTLGTGIGALAGLLVVLFAYFLIKPDVHRRMKREDPRIVQESSVYLGKVLISTAMPIIIGTAIYSITNLADMSMVMGRLLDSGAFTSEQAEVLYGQLQGKFVVLTTLPVAISTSIATAAIPNIAASVALKDTESVNRKITTAIRISMIISIPSAIGMGVLADQILKMLFPVTPDGGGLLKVGAVAVIFLALSQIVTGTLQGIGHFKVPAINAVFGAIVKIVLNYFLIVIPFINVYGAVLSTIGCYIVASLLNLRKLVKITHIRPNYISIIWKPIAASAAMGVCCYFSYQLFFNFTQSNAVSTLIAILLGMAVYGVIMLLIQGITREDIKLLPMGNKINGLLDSIGFQ